MFAVFAAVIDKVISPLDVPVTFAVIVVAVVEWYDLRIIDDAV
jgi:hypothetical protein